MTELTKDKIELLQSLQSLAEQVEAKLFLEGETVLFIKSKHKMFAYIYNDDSLNDLYSSIAKFL
ncbi:MAG: hypothetical protein DRJ01_09710 [Bacteroidetes bacterium]|nr:MAG: hypothetical protein DRJ01_09710 [Bacteroidota bacterium]